MGMRPRSVCNVCVCASSSFFFVICVVLTPMMSSRRKQGGCSYRTRFCHAIFRHALGCPRGPRGVAAVCRFRVRAHAHAVHVGAPCCGRVHSRCRHGEMIEMSRFRRTNTSMARICWGGWMRGPAWLCILALWDGADKPSGGPRRYFRLGNSRRLNFKVSSIIVGDVGRMWCDSERTSQRIRPISGERGHFQGSLTDFRRLRRIWSEFGRSTSRTKQMGGDESDRELRRTSVRTRTLALVWVTVGNVQSSSERKRRSRASLASRLTRRRSPSMGLTPGWGPKNYVSRAAPSPLHRFESSSVPGRGLFGKGSFRTMQAIPWDGLGRESAQSA